MISPSTRRTASWLVFGGLAVSVAACGGDAPTSTTTSPVTPSPAVAFVTAVTITGLSTLAVGQTAQLGASAALSDGTRKDVTSQASWQSSNVAVATVSRTGLVTVKGPGDTDVTATFQSVQGTAHVAVAKQISQPVRFDISGVVHESAPTQGVALSGATVGIHFVGCPTCPHDNEATTTDDTGHFTLRGIETAGFSLVVSKPGYDTTQFGVVQLPRDSHPDIAMRPADISSDITGTDVCTEHPIDPFFSGLCRREDHICCENQLCELKARTMAVFDVHRDGTANSAFSPFVFPFQGYDFGLVYYISSSGQAVVPPSEFGPLGGWTVTAGTRYYFVIGGYTERCHFSYRLFNFRHPQ
jgi:hypothetical protein